MTMRPSAQTIIKRHQVEQLTGLSRNEIYLRIKNGRFPKPVNRGSTPSLWNWNEVYEWVATRKASDCCCYPRI